MTVDRDVVFFGTMGNGFGCVSITFFFVSLASHLALLVRLDPGRDTCRELIGEASATLGLNSALFILGSFYVLCSGAYDEWMSGYSRMVLSALSAVVVILSARLTLFVYAADAICPVDLHKHSLPADDVLVDASSREMSGALSWIALVAFGAAVLLQEFDREECNVTYEVVADCDGPTPCPPNTNGQPCPPYTNGQPCPPNTDCYGRPCPPSTSGQPCPPSGNDSSRRILVLQPQLRC